MNFFVQFAFCLLLLLSASRPARSAGLDGYSDESKWLARIDALRPNSLVQIRSLALTEGKREVHLIRIGRPDKASRPALLIVGNVVAPHVVGGEIALGMAEWFVAHAADESVKTLIDTTCLYIIPRPNPDGAARIFARPFDEADGNGRKTDDDRDFEFGEDPPDDLNGDGYITQMRIADPAGTHRVHPDDPRLMIPADPAKGEVGTHRLLVEGIDQDKDEKWNEDAGLGVSFNKNFPAKYAFYAKGAGPNAVSEPETRALADFCFDHADILAILTFAPEDNLYFPPKPGGEEKIKTKIQPADTPIHEHFAKRYQEILGQKNPPTSPEPTGSFADWGYLQFGRFSFAARGWWIPPKEEPKKEDKPEEKKPTEEKKKEDRDADGQRALAWFDEQKIDGFVPWTAVNHPDFPGRSVEVGGFKPLYRWNPPANQLPSLAEKHARFVIELAGGAPRLAVTKQTIDRPAGASVARLRVKLSNAGLIPTMSAMGKTTEAVYPLNWKWNLPKGVSLAAGTMRGQTEPIKGGDEVEIEGVVLIDGAISEPISLNIESPSVRSIQPILFDLSKEASK